MFDQFIQHQPELEGLCQQLRSEPWIALDTEFVRERTYYAKPCLIQLATPSAVIAVDPLAMPHLDPLLDIVYEPQILKVFHAARQDLELFYDMRGAVPTPVFDTQIAAALVGYEDQTSYATLVESVLAIRLEKHATRTDWSKRPLTAAQLHYAEEDVRYLRDVYPRLTEKLLALRRSKWLAEECTRLTDTALYRNDPVNAYTRIKQGHLLPAVGQPVLAALACWREHTAQTLDRPRNWILHDAVLLELARIRPQRVEQLSGIKGLAPKNAKRWGDVLVKQITTAPSDPTVPLWETSTPLTARQLALYERMLECLRACARRLGLSLALIASRKDVQALVRGDTGGTLLKGWRRQVVGEELLSMLGSDAADLGVSSTDR
ncbi:MAG: ribonuclease D [Acidiferrobacterales bacterium]|nr:ribonuclease D [Acidiferrobacterales bacterium]